jgi:hypothetical protein
MLVVATPDNCMTEIAEQAITSVIRAVFMIRSYRIRL